MGRHSMVALQPEDGRWRPGSPDSIVLESPPTDFGTATPFGANAADGAGTPLSPSATSPSAADTAVRGATALRDEEKTFVRAPGDGTAGPDLHIGFGSSKENSTISAANTVVSERALPVATATSTLTQPERSAISCVSQPTFVRTISWLYHPAGV
jgi:hypothetical protein